MTRTLRRYFAWLVLLAGCSSQSFCDFEDTAPIISLPVPDNVASAQGWGTVLMPMAYEEGGQPRDFIAAAGGPRSQSEVFQLAVDGELYVEVSATQNGICDRHAALDDESSTCWERHAGAGLAFRSSWSDGQNCLVVGMAGHERDPGVGFWCAEGTRHMENDRSFVGLDHEVRTLTHVMAPVERVFAGTRHTLSMLDGDQREFVRVLWHDDDTILPPRGSPVDALSTIETEEVPGGYLLAVGVPEFQQVLIGEVETPVEGEEEAELVLRGCIEVEEEGFGSVVKLARLGTSSADDPGPLVLLGSSAWGYENRVPAVHIFELDLTVLPEDVACSPTTPFLSLECGEISDVDDGVDKSINVDCTVENAGFGTAVDVGNIDDTPEHEVVVGCPGATADGYDRAGAAYIFRPSRNNGDVVSVLIDSNEDRQDVQLGAGVALAPVGDRDEPIVAGPGEGSLLMFLCSGVGDIAPEWDSPLSGNNSLEDPRCRNPER